MLLGARVQPSSVVFVACLLYDNWWPVTVYFHIGFIIDSIKAISSLVR